MPVCGRRPRRRRRPRPAACRTASAARRRGAASAGPASPGDAEEAEVLVPVARAVAEPGPDHQIAGDRAAGPGGEILASSQSPVAVASSASASSRAWAVVCAAAAPCKPSQTPSSIGAVRNGGSHARPRLSFCFAAYYHSVCGKSAGSSSRSPSGGDLAVDFSITPMRMGWCIRCAWVVHGLYIGFSPLFQRPSRLRPARSALRPRPFPNRFRADFRRSRRPSRCSKAPSPRWSPRSATARWTRRR